MSRDPRGPKDCKTSISRGNIEKSSFEYGKIHSKIQIRIWELRGQNPHCKDLPLKRFKQECFFLHGRLEFFIRSSENDMGPKTQRNFFVQSFSGTLRVMDVRTKNRGRPRQQVSFPAAPVMGRNFLTPGHPGVWVRNVHRKEIRTEKFMFMLLFFPELIFLFRSLALCG